MSVADGTECWIDWRGKRGVPLVVGLYRLRQSRIDLKEQGKGTPLELERFKRSIGVSHTDASRVEIIRQRNQFHSKVTKSFRE